MSTRSRSSEPHRLTEKDKAGLTATCSVCGPSTKIKRKGKYGYACREAERQSDRRRNAQRRRPTLRPSEHQLTNRDGSPDTCVICGPVAPMMWRRGWMCPTRAKQLGWVADTAQQVRCPICKTWLDRLGGCARCDDDYSDLDTKYLPAESRQKVRTLRAADRVGIEDGFSFRLPEDLGELNTESTVANWKIIGPEVDPSSPWYPQYLRIAK